MHTHAQGMRECVWDVKRGRVFGRLWNDPESVLVILTVTRAGFGSGPGSRPGPELNSLESNTLSVLTRPYAVTQTRTRSVHT